MILQMYSVPPIPYKVKYMSWGMIKTIANEITQAIKVTVFIMQVTYFYAYSLTKYTTYAKSKTVSIN